MKCSDLCSRCAGMQVFQKVQLLSCQSNEHLALCSFWSVVVFTWILTLTACSSLNVVLGSFVTSWLSHQCATKLQTLQMALWSSPDWQMLLTLLLSFFLDLHMKSFSKCTVHHCVTQLYDTYTAASFAWPQTKHLQPAPLSYVIFIYLLLLLLTLKCFRHNQSMPGVLLLAANTRVFFLKIQSITFPELCSHNNRAVTSVTMLH